MADSSNSKTSASAQSTTASGSSKKGTNVKAAVKANSSPTKAPSSKSTTPVKPSTPKSSTKSPTSPSSTPTVLPQKNNVVKNNPISSNKKSTIAENKCSELKQTASETIGKKPLTKSTVNKSVESTIKQKSNSTEKLTDPTSQFTKRNSKTKTVQNPNIEDFNVETGNNLTSNLNDTEVVSPILPIEKETLIQVNEKVESAIKKNVSTEYSHLTKQDLAGSNSQSNECEPVERKQSTEIDEIQSSLSKKEKVKSEENIEADYIIVQPEETEDKFENKSEIDSSFEVSSSNTFSDLNDKLVCESSLLDTSVNLNLNPKPVRETREEKCFDSNISPAISNNASNLLSCASSHSFINERLSLSEKINSFDNLKIKDVSDISSAVSSSESSKPNEPNESPNSQNSVNPSTDSKKSGLNKTTEETKNSIRLKVWDLLEKNNHVLFPRPCKGRIPHFVGSPEAADKLATLDDFKKASNIKVNPDKPQAHVRFLTLEAGKNLLVPIPRLRSGLFKRIIPPAGATKEELKTVVTQQGVLSSGEALGLDDKIKIDLVVMGAVAVSKQGYRIGKGEGYADLEFAIMMKMGAITQDTVVITTVHDEQVFDTLPEHLFKEHDVPVDFIVTPTNVYEVKPRLPKPSGIFWNILSNRRLQLMPILKTLREKEIAEGNACLLKEVESDPEDRPVTRFLPFFPKRSRQPQMKNRSRKSPRDLSAPSNNSNVRSYPKNRQSRTYRRKPSGGRSNSFKDQQNVNEPRNFNQKKQNMVEHSKAGGDNAKPMRPKYYKKPRGPIAFSIKLSGITRGTRVRDLKSALNERGIKPYDITWVSNKGHALLHFSQMEMYKDKKPVFLTDMSSVDVVEGFPAKLEFKMPINAKACKYEWSLNGNKLTPSDRVKFMSKLDGTAGLFITGTNIEDSGEYSVIVKNKHGEINATGTINVTAKTKANTPQLKPSFTEEVSEVSVNKNSLLHISLSIAGNPAPDIEWSKDGVVLQQNYRIQFTYDGNKVGLKINGSKLNDAGDYKCKLKNDLGESESKIKVVVNSLSESNNQLSLLSKIISLQDITAAMDGIIASLQNLRVKGEGEEESQGSLSVEPANSISRVESTGITTV